MVVVGTLCTDLHVDERQLGRGGKSENDAEAHFLKLNHENWYN
jgi:hypothetical protein